MARFRDWGEKGLILTFGENVQKIFFILHDTFLPFPLFELFSHQASVLKSSARETTAMHPLNFILTFDAPKIMSHLFNTEMNPITTTFSPPCQIPIVYRIFDSTDEEPCTQYRQLTPRLFLYDAPLEHL